MPNDINSYRLTSLEEPPEEYLAQIMREAAEDAEKENQAATQKYFEELQQNILKSKECSCNSGKVPIFAKSIHYGGGLTMIYKKTGKTIIYETS